MSAPRAARWIVPIALVVVWLAIGGTLGPYAGRLGEVTTNEQSSFLPSNAEATRVLEQQSAFQPDRTIPAIVVWEVLEGRITPGSGRRPAGPSPRCGAPRSSRAGRHRSSRRRTAWR